LIRAALRFRNVLLALDGIFLFGRPLVRWINSFGELERHVVGVKDHVSDR